MRSKDTSGFFLVDIVDDRLDMRSYANTHKPLVFSVEDVREGKLVGKPCKLPRLKGKVLALDLETRPDAQYILTKGAALEPYLGKIRLIQITDGNNIWLVDTYYVPDWKDWLRKTLEEAAAVISHNARFECKFITNELGFININWRCTHTASLLIEFAERHDLASTLSRWLGVILSKELQTSDWSAEVVTEAQLLYALRDVAWLHELHESMEEALRAKGMFSLYTDLEAKLIPVLAEIEQTGMPVNHVHTEEMFSNLSKKVSSMEEETRIILAQVYNEKGVYSNVTSLLTAGYISSNTILPPPSDLHPSDINLSSNLHIMQLLASIGIYLDSTDRDHLAEAASKLDIEISGRVINLADTILTYKEQSKLLEFVEKLSTVYPDNPDDVEPGRAYLHPATQRIHTEFRMLATGRLGATGGSDSDDGAVATFGAKTNKDRPWITNLQQFPRGSDIRNCFGFLDHEDLVFIGCDYSALESFLAAHLSQDPGLIKAVNDPDVDFHTRNASICYGIPVDQVDPATHRQVAKNVIYCKFYGGGPAKVAHTANQVFIRKHIPIRLSREEAEEFCNKIDAAYSKLTQYMQSVVEYSKHHPLGETIPSKLGRRRYLVPEIEAKRSSGGTVTLETKAMNNPMQTGNAEIIKLALKNVWYDIVLPYRESSKFIQVGTPVHDELILFSYHHDAQEVSRLLKNSMEKAAAFIMSDSNGVPTFPNYEVTPKIGRSWGGVH